MKKVITILVVLVMLIVLGISVSAGPEYVQIGDANANGVIDMGDATAVELMTLGIMPVKSYADANWDGDVNMADVIYIERIILGLSETIHP
jgi:hypothetical protein